MRTIEDYMAMPYRMEIVEDSDEGGFVASYPDLPGCISCGETVEAAAANAQDAKRAWLEAAMEDGIAIREPDSLDDYSGQFKLRIPEKSAQVPCGAFSARGHKHEPVLRISPFPQRRRIFKVTSLPFRNI